MLVRRIHEDELMEARNISSLCFDWVHDTEGKNPEEYIKQIKENPSSKGDAYFYDTFAAFTDEEEMMACLSVLPYEVSFDSSILKMAGIGGVCTYPQHRRKGAVQKLFWQALTDMYERGVHFSYLYPFSEKFYSRYGYVPSSFSIRWSFDLKTIPDASYEGTFHLYTGDENYTEFDFAYQVFAAQYNMMVHRDSYDWSTLKNANPFKGSRQAYLYKDSEGTPRGYIIFEKSNDQNQIVLECKEMIFDNFETLKAIMSFIKSFSSHYDKVLFNAPGCLPLNYFCEDYSQSNSSRTIIQNGMVRVINAAEVLKHAKYNGDGELRIRITDSLLEANDKVFQVIFKDNKAEKVVSICNLSNLNMPLKPIEGQTIETALSKEEIDMEMTINQFSAVIVGLYDIADLDYLEGITLYCSKEKAGRLIFKKPCWINNHF